MTLIPAAEFHIHEAQSVTSKYTQAGRVSLAFVGILYLAIGHPTKGTVYKLNNASHTDKTGNVKRNQRKYYHLTH